MISNDNRWKKLFLFCLGLTFGTAFCMKWMENDFYVNGEKFTIMGLELFYPRQKLVEVLSALQPREATILRYHLSFDFPFMAGVYPGITALCMMARQRLRSVIFQRVLFVVAAIQLAAWVCDIAENYYLLKWVNDPGSIPSSLGFYHFLVSAKWIIALVGVLVAVTGWALRGFTQRTQR